MVGVLCLHQRDEFLSVQALVHARDLTASQVPIILWAFIVLRYSPVVAVLSALDQQIEKLSGQMTAQVSRPTHASQPAHQPARLQPHKRLAPPLLVCWLVLQGQQVALSECP